jgi:hypothetical protein
MKKFLPYDLKIKRLNKSYIHLKNSCVDSVDTLPNDIFTEYWDVLEEEQDETGFKKVPSLYRIMICLTFKVKSSSVSDLSSSLLSSSSFNSVMS